MNRAGLSCAAVAALLTVLLTGASVANANFKGQNGLIAFDSWTGTSQDIGVFDRRAGRRRSDTTAEFLRADSPLVTRRDEDRLHGPPAIVEDDQRDPLLALTVGHSVTAALGRYAERATDRDLHANAAHVDLSPDAATRSLGRGATLVFGLGSTIYSLRPRDHAPHVVAKVDTVPIGLSTSVAALHGPRTRRAASLSGPSVR